MGYSSCSWTQTDEEEEELLLSGKDEGEQDDGSSKPLTSESRDQRLAEER